MQPPKSFEEFQASRAARQAADAPKPVNGVVAPDLAAKLTESVKQAKSKRGRKPAPPKPPVEKSLADAIQAALDIAIARRGRPLREDAVREQTLLEVLIKVVKAAA
jgi:hypothetical protein